MAKTKTAFMTPATKRNKERIEETEKELEELESNEETEEEGKEEETLEPKSSTPEDDTWKKRYGDLRTHSMKQKRELQEQIDQLKEQVKSSTKIQAPASDEDLDAWKKKYPDVARIVESLAIKIAEDKVKDTREEIEVLRSTQKQSAKDKALERIVQAHPDFYELQTDDDFHDWVDDQSQWVQDALYENDEDAKAVISVINLYKAEKGIYAKDTDKEAAKVVKTNKGRPKVDADSMKGTFTESQVNRMSAADYAKNEEAIMEAMRNGKFVYDMSGAA